MDPRDDMDTRLRETFRSFTDAELVDMVLDHSGTKSPKSQRIARQVLDERGLTPLDYAAVIEQAERDGELARIAQRPPPLPRPVRVAAALGGLAAAGLAYGLGREVVFALFVGAMGGVATAFAAAAIRRRYLHHKGLGHALRA
ncbi:MAG: hypothetical protein D6739_12150 [Nitrospirae bacterium]|nr:MAG: hypothetical protein D6739_12150 [Nitrospirota bacterium]